jgi:hypothetical protein
VGAGEVLGDLPADAAELLSSSVSDLSGGLSLRLSHSGGGANVLLGDPPAGPASGQRLELDSELLRDAADERRRADLSGTALSGGLTSVTGL